MTEFLRGVAARLAEAFDPQSLAAAVAGFAANLVVAVVIFLAFYLVWKLVARVAVRVMARAGTDRTTVRFVESALQLSILTIGLVQALSALGINTTALLTSLGIVGLTIGFAARDALSNLISGLLIFWDRPFVIGDLVEVDDDYGRVQNITLRSTRIVTVDGKMLAVPNSHIVNSTVTSYTNFPHLRLDVAVTVAPAEDIDRVRRLLLELVTEEAGFMEKPPPRVVVTQLNDYNVEVQLQAWIRNERDHVEMRFELRERVFETLRDAGIDMPSETIRLEAVELKGSLTPPGAQ
ncbi:MAG TPA: mechanosensitive ion channel [Longimicrobiales bacterium]|nr:mechanosensitive ion channel [Longimicrobiales bacterium]